LQLGDHQEVRAGGLLTHGKDGRGIAFQVTDPLVHLGKGDDQAIGHAGDLALEPSSASQAKLYGSMTRCLRLPKR
jgi:hypothetical protein